MDRNHTPQELFKVGEDAFRIVWQDGHRSDYNVRDLRMGCPCAACRDEWTGKQLLNPLTVPHDLKLSEARLVGNYAVQFVFSDGHSTGIFSFEKMRGLCPDCKEKVED